MSDPIKIPEAKSSRPFVGRWVRIAAIILVLLGAAAAAAYHYVTTGGLIARQRPSRVEASVAQWLVDASVPAEARAQKSPLSPTAGDIAAGGEIYRRNCVACHGYDGSGDTAAGDGLYPPPTSLRRTSILKRNHTDGELFYFIRNGIRNTGMPGWRLPDEETWQLVAFVRNLPVTVSAGGQAADAEPIPPASTAHYVGSVACARCHTGIYERWSKTAMANVVLDPKKHPGVIIPDLSKPDPLVHFTADDIAFVYGHIWKQRYFKKVGDDYYPLPAQWDVKHGQWKPYFAKDDWWSKYYPPDNFQRPTSALCDGCHSVNYDINTKTVTEWNVGCEKCHGPGSEHVRNPIAANIVNPSRMAYVAANDTCIQCHSQGRPLQNPIQGKYYDWPVGFDMTKKLDDYWQLEGHRLGETTFTHFADGTAHKNRMQGNDYVTSQMYAHGVTCFTCHDAHGTANPGSLREPAQQLCLECHGPTSPNGPHAATIEQHTHHLATSAGSQCIACHMPPIAQTIGDVNVRSHTFQFVSPAKTDSLNIPNACNACHTDKTTSWAGNALKNWADRSSWRMAQ